MPATSDLRVAEYPPFLAMPPHVHASVTMNVVLEGEFLERIGGRERHYAGGHVALFPSDLAHSQQFGRAGARQIIIDPSASWLDYLADARARADANPAIRSPSFRLLGNRLAAEIDANDDLAVLAREGIVLEILAAFGRTVSHPSTGARTPSWLRAADDYLRANIGSPLSLAAIARAAGRHEIHLAREFRRYYGCSIGDHVRRLRTELAARLLLETTCGIAEIAMECGFSSHAHLCREFRAKFGTTPSTYRCAQRGK